MGRFGMAKNKQGRPVEYTEKRLKEICNAMDEYTDKTAVPIVAEFAFNYDIRKSTLYDQPGLSHSLKRMTAKKEFQLEKMAMTNKINTAFAIFSLKQMGWSDRLQLQGDEDKPLAVKMVTLSDVVNGNKTKS